MRSRLKFDRGEMLQSTRQSAIAGKSGTQYSRPFSAASLRIHVMESSSFQRDMLAIRSGSRWRVKTLARNHSTILARWTAFIAASKSK